METNKTKQTKTSLVKHAAWLAVLDAVCIISNLALIIKSQITFTAEDYLSPIPLPMLIPLVSLILLTALIILTIIQSKSTEKVDELAKLNRYKAGNISKYICIVGIIIAIWTIQDFGFAFTGDFFDNLRLPLSIFMFVQFTENVIFIILEKFNFE